MKLKSVFKNVQRKACDEQSENKNISEKRPPGFLSQLFFGWTIRLFYQGYFRDLDESDLVPAPTKYSSEVVGDKLERKWLEEVAAAKKCGREPSFSRALFKAFALSYIPAGVLLLFFMILMTIYPLLFAQLLTYWSASDSDGISRTTAAYYAIAMVGCNLLGSIFQYTSFLSCQQFGMKLRVAVSSLMFRKIFRMSNMSMNDTATGKVVNLLSNDLQRFDFAFLFLHHTWIVPLQLALLCYLGYLHAGFAAIIGLFTLLLTTIPLQCILGKMSGKVRLRVAEKTDARIKVMNEVVNGIQVIKMYAWEIPFEKVVDEKRKDELRQVRVATMLRAALMGFLLYTERTALFITILTYILFGNSLSAKIIYPLQQFMMAAQPNVTVGISMMMTFTAELIVTLGRIQEFMSQEERSDVDSILSNTMNKKKQTTAIATPLYTQKCELSASLDSTINVLHPEFLYQSSKDYAVKLENVSASWTEDPNTLALSKISLLIPRNELCAVIGAVGSGKSSFLQLLLRELPVVTGKVSICGKISYASQEAWLFPSTVRENILFGSSYDPVKYKTICRVCALEKDFKQFPHGDQSLVGERGVSLSGGQRTRINLARAVYREADIYLLDDPLSAVDAHVGRRLFEDCINGYLNGRTRILITHQIHLLKAADLIIVLNEGSVQQIGTYHQLASSGNNFISLLAALDANKDSEGEITNQQTPNIRKKSNKSRKISVSDGEEQTHEVQTRAAEERQSGNIHWKIIKAYFLTGSHWTFVLFTIFTVQVSALAGAAVDYWVSYWTNQIAAYENKAVGPLELGLDAKVGQFTISRYLTVHGVLVVVVCILTIVRIIPFAQMCIASSDKLHNKMFTTMLSGVMRFFDTSSSGRILNRFAKDMGSLDEVLPRTLFDMFQIASVFFTVLLLNAIALYWTIIPSVILLIVFGFIVKIYIKTAQNIKRLEGTTKSPVFGLVASTQNGIATIRSTGAQKRLIEEFDRLQDQHTSAWNSFLSGAAVLAIGLDTICVSYLTTIIFCLIYLDLDGIIAVGSVGLVVTQSSTLMTMLQYGVRMVVEFVAQLTAVERVLDYTNIETEHNLVHGDIPTPSSWPSAGKIIFQNVNLRYTPDEPLVLKDLNFIIESGSKIGIVGRTGAGKSSLISALFRFAYIDGTMTIDGINTSLVSKQDLRSKISIIPQEPVLFSATIRYNLDPFNACSDDEIWRALEKVDMKVAITSLDFKVTEGGSNFSVGQRQLMCLARAILRSNKILIMDEATANVDPQTDNFIQQTIRRQFADCTVLTIAHRLNTVMDADRVLVMDSGRAAEFDHPYTLLSNDDSLLSRMVYETGDKNALQLKDIAKTTYYQSDKKMKQHITSEEKT